MPCPNSIQVGSLVRISGIPIHSNKVGIVISKYTHEDEDYKDVYDWFVYANVWEDVWREVPAWDLELVLLPTNI